VSGEHAGDPLQSTGESGDAPRLTGAAPGHLVAIGRGGHGAGEELEILYAVETASPAGASVKSNGDVEVGIDGSGIIEFNSLDALIECDSMLDLMRRFSVESREYLNQSQVSHIVDVLHSDPASGLGFVPEASGKHCHWFDSDAIAVLVCGTWAELGSVMNPVLHIWSDSRDAIERVKRLIA
jgi:hypothetical protein